MKDTEIIELYWARNEAAITATADKYGGYCYTISYNILHSNEDAEECVNDAYLGAWKSIPPHRPTDTVGGEAQTAILLRRTWGEIISGQIIEKQYILCFH